MDVAALVRDEWSSLGGFVVGLAAAIWAASRGEWHWVAGSICLSIFCPRVLQAEGWILQDPIIGE